MEVDAQANIEEEKPASPPEGTTAPSSEPPSGETKLKTEETKEKKDGEEGEKKEPEPTEEILANPCRVVHQQKQYISFPTEIDGQAVRYTPLLPSRRVGFVLLTDSRPEEPEELFDDCKGEPEEKEPDPPAPFDWSEEIDG